MSASDIVAVCFRDQFDAGFILRADVTMKSDKTFSTRIIPFLPPEKELAYETGKAIEDVVEGYVRPPTDPEQYDGVWKGVQGDQNSCYMDASVFAMFSYLTVFDVILFDETEGSQKGDENDERKMNIRRILLEEIINPLRKYVLGVHL